MVLRLLERGFFVAFIYYLMGVATALFYADMDYDSFMTLQGTLHLPIMIVQASLALFGAFLILTRWRRVAAASLKAWPLLVLAALQFLSIAWSINPVLTLRKAILELVFLFIGFYLGERYTTTRFAVLLSQALCFAMAIVMVLYFAAPHFVLDSERHLKGLSQHKNGFGFYMGLTVALLIQVRFRKYDWLRFLLMPLACGFLLLSRSMTSVASAAIIIASLPAWLAVRLRPRQRIVGYIALALVIGTIGYILVTTSTYLLAMIGRDATLTGRTEVWKQVVVAIHHRPLLGYGYGAFWTGLTGESLDVFIAAGWLAPAAHNAWLELWLALGLPGFAVASLILWRAFRMAIEYIRMVPGWVGLWPVACILFVLVHGLGESEFICDSSFACCLFTALYTSLAIRNPSRVRRCITTPAEVVSA